MATCPMQLDSVELSVEMVSSLVMKSVIQATVSPMAASNARFKKDTFAPVNLPSADAISHNLPRSAVTAK